ncbi:MAG: ThiF family adenylyltransferase [Acidobacteria bacterium]|nr:ThiF family adenylyltransferase [Acidobacteriota bacterium]MBI3490072.1 ThiF family adenylyltransferase [Acidobacteriota bacterium]
MTARTAKQRIFLGTEADAALRRKRVAIVGLGATGSVQASWLARAGVGHLTVIDRDFVELSNLQRQILYVEADLGQLKAEAAAKRLSEAHSGIELKPVVADLTSGNARELLSGFDLICDGTDNFEARFLINDVAILTGTPWIYAGAIGGEGVVWPLNPPHTPCLRCLIEEPPAGGDVDTCDSAGVLGPTVGIIGSWAAMEAIKVLTGKPPHGDLARFDFWNDERQFLKSPKSRCRFCTGKVTEFLDARWSLKASALCGLEGVQIRVNPPGKLDLAALKQRLETRTHSPWKQAGLMLKGREGEDEITLFADGRALVHGPMTPERARSWYTEVVGC